MAAAGLCSGEPLGSLGVSLHKTSRYSIDIYTHLIASLAALNLIAKGTESPSHEAISPQVSLIHIPHLPDW
jgi:hypothetical protein